MARPSWPRLILLLASAALLMGGIALFEAPGSPPLAGILPTPLLDVAYHDHAPAMAAGTLLVLLGCVAAWIWLPAARDAPAAPASDAPPIPPAASRPRLRAPLLVGAGLTGVVAYAYALDAALHPPSTLTALLCLLVALALIGLLIARLAPGAVPAAAPRSARLDRRDWLAIGALTLAFVLLTSWDLRSWLYAYWGDEWPFYRAARAIAAGGPFDPFAQAGVYSFNPVLDSLYQATIMRLFGENVVGWRLSSALAPALPIAALYWLGVRLCGRAVAATAAVIYTVCPLLWAFAHIGYNNNDALLSMIPAAAFCYLGLREHRLVALYAAGICAGFGWYTLFTGRLMIVVLLLAALTEWRGGPRAVGQRLAALAGGFALALAPFALLNGSSTLTEMPRASNFSLDSAWRSGLLERNTVRAAYEFLYADVHHHYTAGALLDPISGAGLCLGLLLAIRRRRTLGARLLVIWLALTVGLTTPLNYAEGITVTRSMVAIPPAALLAALGLCGWCRALAAALAPPRWTFRALLSALLAGVVALNLYHFYGYVNLLPQRWPPYPVLVTTFEAILTAPPGATFILPADLARQDVNGDFCSVIDGFGIEPGRLQHVVGAGLQPYCPVAVGAPPIIAGPRTMLLLDSLPPARCATAATHVYAENQGSVWAFQLPVAPQPAGSYTVRAAQAARAICPS